MTTEQQLTCRYFVSYSGVKLPLKLVTEISAEGLHNRNTYYRGYFDSQDKIQRCEKVVYGEVDSEHIYEYYPTGILKHAQIHEDDEIRDIYFDEAGGMISE